MYDATNNSQITDNQIHLEDNSVLINAKVTVNLVRPRGAPINYLPDFQVPVSFHGRTQFLDDLHAAVDRTSKGKDVVSRMTIIAGKGGIGKTSTARMYITKYEDHHRHISWIEAETRSSLLRSFYRLATHFKLRVAARLRANEEADWTNGDRDDLVDGVYSHFSRHVHGGQEGQGLFVFDGANQMGTSARGGEGLESFLPRKNYRRLPLILVTSRNKVWGSLTFWEAVPVLDLGSMTEVETVTFLRNALRQTQGMLEPNAMRLGDDKQKMDPAILSELEVQRALEGMDEADQAGIRELWTILGGIPLALTLAAANILTPVHIGGLSLSRVIADYISEFNRNAEGWLNRAMDDWLLTDPYDKIMATVWKGSIDRMILGSETSKTPEVYGLALDLLRLIAVLPRDQLSFRLLVRLARLSPSIRRKKVTDIDATTNLALGVLEREFSLITRTKKKGTNECTIDVHQLVQKWTKQDCQSRRDAAPLLTIAALYREYYEPPYTVAWFRGIPAEFAAMNFPDLSFKVCIYYALHEGLQVKGASVQVMEDIFNYLKPPRGPSGVLTTSEIQEYFDLSRLALAYLHIFKSRGHTFLEWEEPLPTETWFGEDWTLETFVEWALFKAIEFPHNEFMEDLVAHVLFRLKRDGIRWGGASQELKETMLTWGLSIFCGIQTRRSYRIYRRVRTRSIIPSYYALPCLLITIARQLNLSSFTPKMLITTIVETTMAVAGHQTRDLTEQRAWQAFVRMLGKLDIWKGYERVQRNYQVEARRLKLLLVETPNGLDCLLQGLSWAVQKNIENICVGSYESARLVGLLVILQELALEKESRDALLNSKDFPLVLKQFMFPFSAKEFSMVSATNGSWTVGLLGLFLLFALFSSPENTVVPAVTSLFAPDFQTFYNKFKSAEVGETLRAALSSSLTIWRSAVRERTILEKYLSAHCNLLQIPAAATAAARDAFKLARLLKDSISGQGGQGGQAAGSDESKQSDDEDEARHGVDERLSITMHGLKSGGVTVHGGTYADNITKSL